MSGTLFVVAAPSGAGKTSLVKALLEREPGIVLSVSHTTRPPRPGEVEGQHYHFISRGEFAELVKRNAFLEHAEVFGNHYGTSRASVVASLGAGRDVLLEIDWQGAALVRAKMKCCRIFILPPSREELLRRLRARGQDSEAVIARRTAEARAEIAHCNEFDYIIVNDDFATALGELRAVVTAQRLRRAPQQRRYAALIADLLA
jgi:guanylate kinase